MHSKALTSYYLAHTHSPYGQCNVFTVSVLSSVHGGGGVGQMHYLANVPQIEHILAIKVLMPVGGGGGGSRQMH